jgi:endoribonuclease Nob1
MRYVLDTTALFNAKDFPPDFEIVVPQGVLDELASWDLSDRVTNLLGVKIHVFTAGAESRKTIREAAKKTGDIDRLSPIDMEVLALAVEMRAPLISDDYSIQNVAKVLNLNCIPMEQQGIKKVFYWKYKCRGCGKEYDRKIKECQICGKELKPFRYKSE